MVDGVADVDVRIVASDPIGTVELIIAGAERSDFGDEAEINC
jgi:hypothetical protein